MEKFNQIELDKRIIKNLQDYFFKPMEKWFNFIWYNLGCGTGRWARFIAPQVKQLTVVDAIVSFSSKENFIEK